MKEVCFRFFPPALSSEDLEFMLLQQGLEVKPFPLLSVVLKQG